MKKSLSIFTLLFYIFIPKAQTINMDFPRFAGKTYDFVIFNGDKEIKLIQDTIPENGKFELRIPSEYSPYTGMSRWLITNSSEGGGLDLAIPGFGYAVSCKEEQPTTDNLLFKGYNPLSKINDINNRQRELVGKFNAMNAVMKFYNTQDKLYPVFEKELKVQQNAFEDFKKELAEDKDYFSRLFPIVSIINGIPVSLTGDTKMIYRETNEYITNQIDIDLLYTSGFWTPVLEFWAEINTSSTENDNSFLYNFKKLSNRIPDHEKYKSFISTITSYLSKYGKDKEIELITPIVLQSSKIHDYSGNLSIYKNSVLGKTAPDLIITKHIGNIKDHNHQTTNLSAKDFADTAYTLIIFYESGCGPCEELLQQLPNAYKKLQEKGVKIIAISADKSQQIFESKSSDFPWKDTFCDFEGRTGVNFKNYGVQGTPTIFLIDKNGVVVSKYSVLKKVLEDLKLN
ncbi:thioredoxin family protein [Chryseobacterium sp.]|uniref:peroxiredoxin family protein n=1 Tax=Chryseobacterium sp. TaxID=1871047 RepID=UPI0023F7B220|nr:thioredoxin family protein [Chryseobacterium sp.]